MNALAKLLKQNEETAKMVVDVFETYSATNNNVRISYSVAPQKDESNNCNALLRISGGDSHFMNDIESILQEKGLKISKYATLSVGGTTIYKVNAQPLANER